MPESNWCSGLNDDEYLLNIPLPIFTPHSDNNKCIAIRDALITHKNIKYIYENHPIMLQNYVHMLISTFILFEELRVLGYTTLNDVYLLFRRYLLKFPKQMNLYQKKEMENILEKMPNTETKPLLISVFKFITLVSCGKHETLINLLNNPNCCCNRCTL